MTLDELERRHILDTMAQVQGDKVKAAAILGINLSTLYRKLARYAVEGHWNPAAPRAIDGHGAGATVDERLPDRLPVENALAFTHKAPVDRH